MNGCDAIYIYIDRSDLSLYYWHDMTRFTSIIRASHIIINSCLIIIIIIPLHLLQCSPTDCQLCEHTERSWWWYYHHDKRERRYRNLRLLWIPHAAFFCDNISLIAFNSRKRNITRVVCARGKSAPQIPIKEKECPVHDGGDKKNTVDFVCYFIQIMTLSLSYPTLLIAAAASQH